MPVSIPSIHVIILWEHDRTISHVSHCHFTITVFCFVRIHIQYGQCRASEESFATRSALFLGHCSERTKSIRMRKGGRRVAHTKDSEHLKGNSRTACTLVTRLHSLSSLISLVIANLRFSLAMDSLIPICGHQEVTSGITYTRICIRTLIEHSGTAFPLDCAVTASLNAECTLGQGVALVCAASWRGLCKKLHIVPMDGANVQNHTDCNISEVQARFGLFFDMPMHEKMKGLAPVFSQSSPYSEEPWMGPHVPTRAYTMCMCASAHNNPGCTLLERIIISSITQQE